MSCSFVENLKKSYFLSPLLLSAKYEKTLLTIINFIFQISLIKTITYLPFLEKEHIRTQILLICQ